MGTADDGDSEFDEPQPLTDPSGVVPHDPVDVVRQAQVEHGKAIAALETRIAHLEADNAQLTEVVSRFRDEVLKLRAEIRGIKTI